MRIAIGEANELENWLYKVRDTALRPENIMRKRLFQTIEVRKMAISLRKRIEENEDVIREPETDCVIDLPSSEDDE